MAQPPPPPQGVQGQPPQGQPPQYMPPTAQPQGGYGPPMPAQVQPQAPTVVIAGGQPSTTIIQQRKENAS